MAARALVAALRAEVERRPDVAKILRTAATVLPETASTVREVLDDPGTAILDALDKPTRKARRDMGDADRSMADGLARAFGRGVRKGMAKRSKR